MNHNELVIMIDKNKRSTLKKFALGTGVVVTGASSYLLTGSQPDSTGEFLELEADNIEVTTRVSATANDIEVVLTNTGMHTVKITHLAPGKLRVARGEFDFASLLADGPLQVESGSSVAVSLKRLPVHQSDMNTPSLTKALKQSLFVTTDKNGFANLSIVGAAMV